jgi:dTDP-4-dehydrorhamnose 3,5-epimerase
MQFDIRKTKIPGCFNIFPRPIEDDRGHFVKTFHEDCFKVHGLETHYTEEYYSLSYKRVLRGLHFQLPPMDHAKVTYCVYGTVLDAVLDLRIGSPTYGDFEMFELSAEHANMVYIPKGMAHGFYVVSDVAIMMYRVTASYSPEHDAGIAWNSAGIPWTDSSPVISVRDSKFVALKDFKSPFAYKESV